MSAPEITILSTAIALVAATPTDLFSLELAQYERVTIAMKNTDGSNDVTGLLWQKGAGALVANDQTVANEVLNNLGAGETAVVTLGGGDVPSKLVVNATSTSGASVTVVVKGVLKAAAILPE